MKSHSPSLSLQRPKLRAIIAATLLSASSIAGIVGASNFLTTVAVAADKEPKAPKVNQKVGLALQAAEAAIRAKDYDLAAAKIKEAEEVKKRTPFDDFKIDEYRAYLYSNQGVKFPEVIAIYEKSLTTPELLAPEAAELRLKQLTALYFNVQNYPKAIEYGKQWLTKHPDDQQIVVLVGKAHYLSKDYAGTLASMKTAIAQSEAAGKVPEEQWLQLVPSSASQLDDQASIVWGYEQLARYYPKPDYWNKLLDRALRAEMNNELGTLYVFRLMDDTAVLAKAENYQEYAQLAVEKAYPGEALKVLESGFAKKVLGNDPKDKAAQQRLLEDVKRKATADRAQLPQAEKEAQSAKANSGQLTAGLGLAYFSLGMYPEAAQALDTGIKQGGLKNIDDYRMALGISQYRAGQKESARAQFQQVPAESPLGRVAKLWAIRTYN